jgi:hypothetical protein
MESRRYYSGGHPRADCCRQIGVTLQTYLLHNRPRQHAWIGRPVRLMARGATFKAHRCVFKGEWAAFVSMALEAARFVGGKALSHRRSYASVRVVAIDAGHRAFRYPVMKWILKLRHYVGVAGGALLVDRGGLACHQAKWTIGVNLVARRAGHLIFGMAALQAAGMRGLAQVASQTDLIGRGSRESPGIANVFGRNGFGVFLTGAVARFAGPSPPAAPGVPFHGVMRVPAERVCRILVTRTTRFGTRIPRRWRRGGTLACGSRSCNYQKRHL